MKNLHLHTFSKWILILAYLWIFASCADRFRQHPIQLGLLAILAEDKSDEYLRVAANESEEYYTQLLLVEQKKDWQDMDNTELLKIYPLHESNLDICLLLMSYYLFINDFETASTLAENAEKLGANKADFFLNKAILYCALNQPDRAIDNINKALLLNANDYEIYLEKGNIYLSYGDTTSAIQFIKMAYEHDQKKFAVLYQLSNLYALTHQADQAWSLINKVLLFDANNEGMLALKAKIQLDQLDNEGAIQTYKKLFRLGNINAGLVITEMFYVQEQYDSAIFYANQLLVSDSLNIVARMSKGNALDKQGYFSAAVLLYEEVLTLDPTNREAMDGMEKVSRKIAYLRRLRDERAAIPTFNFVAPNKKKTINNE